MITVLSKGVLTDYLEKIRNKTAFSKWFFGHYHENREIGEKFVLLYDEMVSGE
ncbi:MAG: hypothetical protein ACYDG2_03725 [Ruminiclostridium sp.]